MVTPDGCATADLWSSPDCAQAVYVLELSRCLAQLGYEVDIWAGPLANYPHIEPVTPQVRIIRLAADDLKVPLPADAAQIQRRWGQRPLQFAAERGLKYDFVISHRWDGGLAGHHFSSELQAPHIHLPHVLGVVEQQCATSVGAIDNEKDFAQRIVEERRLFSAADWVVATSPYQQEVLLRDYAVPREKCRLVVSGYDERCFFPVTDPIRQAIRARLCFTGPVVHAIGRLADEKSCALLINAFAVVSRHIPEAVFKFVVARNTLDADEVAQFIRLRVLVTRLNLSRRVFFKGLHSDHERADFYRAADVLVVPMQYEPFGSTVGEAMACGIPVVMNARGGWYDAMTSGLIREDGDPNDPEDLGRSIAEVLRQPQLRSRFSDKGVQTARNLYAWTHVAREITALAAEKHSGHVATEKPSIVQEPTVQ